MDCGPLDRFSKYDVAQFFATHQKTTRGSGSTNRSVWSSGPVSKKMLTGPLDQTGPIATSDNIGVTAKIQTLRKKQTTPNLLLAIE